jgi:Protein ENHANCED DISEASE RESISTANCE 2, C-terminal
MPTLMIRFLFPWGILNQYYEIPDKLRLFMNAGPTHMIDTHPAMSGLSNSEKALAKWLAGDTTYRNDRLKLIAFVPEGPWIVRNMVTGRPAIIGHKLPVKYSFTPRDDDNKNKKKTQQCEFLQVDLDINSSKPTAKKIVSVCRRYMSSLGVDIGFVIEGKTVDDLPEEMLGAIRLHQADPSCSHTLKSGK